MRKRKFDWLRNAASKWVDANPYEKEISASFAVCVDELQKVYNRFEEFDGWKGKVGELEAKVDRYAKMADRLIDQQNQLIEALTAKARKE